MVKRRSINGRVPHTTVRQPVSKKPFTGIPADKFVEHVAATSVIADAYEDRTDKLLMEIEHLKFINNNQRQAAMWAAKVRDDDKKDLAAMFDELALSVNRVHRADRENSELMLELNPMQLRINSQEQTIEEQRQRIAELIEQRDDMHAVAEESEAECKQLQGKLADYELMMNSMPIDVRPRSAKKDAKIADMMTFDDGEKRRKKGFNKNA